MNLGRHPRSKRFLYAMSKLKSSGYKTFLIEAFRIEGGGQHFGLKLLYFDNVQSGLTLENIMNFFLNRSLFLYSVKAFFK